MLGLFLIGLVDPIVPQPILLILPTLPPISVIALGKLKPDS